MTSNAIQSINNMTIRSILEKEKLYGNNFIDWYRNLQIVLKSERKLHHLENPLPEAPLETASATVRNAYTKQYNEQLEVACLMLTSMTSELQRNLMDYNAYDMIEELKTMFQQQAEHELFETVKAFHACKHELGQPVSQYVLKMKGYLDQLEHLGYAMPPVLGVHLILTSLSKDYDGFVMNYNMHSMGKSIPELHAMLKQAEKGLPKKTPAVLTIKEGKIQKRKPQDASGKGKGKSKQAYTLKKKIPPPAKKEHPAKNMACHHCGQIGHWRRNCVLYLEELKKGKAGSTSTSGIFVIELYNFPNKTWVYDTGYGTHICNDMQGLRKIRKLNKGALDLYVGNGDRSAVEAIGSYELILPSGLILILDNCHYAPSITRGVISVSRLKDNGFNHVFTDYGISKRITKLQHDGLLESTGNESFDICESCLSGKMTKKPFTHQVERASDLLGLIHTDGYALESAARILNMVPNKKVNKTPYEIWHGKVPNLSYLKVWGCEAHVKRDTPNKLESRTIKCIIVGYPKETMGYYFYYPAENKVFTARYAEFLEKRLLLQEASRSTVDLEEIQEQDTLPSEGTSEIRTEPQHESVEVQDEACLIRRSSRTSRPPERLNLMVTMEDFELGDLGEPAN
ncbi:uncharacterized protein [Rutidosis leptorrhynchoides]|uniref:uncharacterized protein n=1 Tax=Rutidosis leptorrhynchoides TaxID=125765 RepID=UPI003A99975C